jgi:hypothetical protein
VHAEAVAQGDLPAQDEAQDETPAEPVAASSKTPAAEDGQETTTEASAS